MKKWIVIGNISLETLAWCENNNVGVSIEAEHIKSSIYSDANIYFTGKKLITLITTSDEQETMLQLMLGDKMECIYSEHYDDEYGTIQQF